MFNSDSSHYNNSCLIVVWVWSQLFLWFNIHEHFHILWLKFFQVLSSSRGQLINIFFPKTVSLRNLHHLNILLQHVLFQHYCTVSWTGTNNIAENVNNHYTIVKLIIKTLLILWFIFYFYLFNFLIFSISCQCPPLFIEGESCWQFDSCYSLSYTYIHNQMLFCMLHYGLFSSDLHILDLWWSSRCVHCFYSITHYNITMGHNVVTDAPLWHNNGNNIARDIHYDITMDNDVAMCT